MKQSKCSIYFIRIHDFVKIGMAKDVQARLRDLQRGNPYRLTLVRVIPNCFRRHELWLHNYFAEHRLEPNTEWFKFHIDMLTVELDATLNNPPPRVRIKRTGGHIKDAPELDKYLARVVGEIMDIASD